MRNEIVAYRVSMGISDGMRTLCRPRYRWDDNIKVLTLRSLMGKGELDE